MLTLSGGWGDPEPEGADISDAGLSPRRSQRWLVSVTGHSLRLEWSLVSSNWSHSSLLSPPVRLSSLGTGNCLLSALSRPGATEPWPRGWAGAAPRHQPLLSVTTPSSPLTTRRTVPPGPKPARSNITFWVRLSQNIEWTQISILF